MDTSKGSELGIVLLSGGIDSTVLLRSMIKRKTMQNVIALSLDYGQLHKREIECAQWQAERVMVPWRLLNVKCAFNGIHTPLLGEGVIPNKSYAEQLDGQEGAVTTYVPNRNMILLSIAAAQCIDIGGSWVAYAAHMDDASRGAYPDCTPEFVDRMNAALLTQNVKLYAPFINNRCTKADIVKQGLEYGIDFSHTWSCYKGKDIACGVCGTCRDRQEAFYKNGAVDPIEYEQKITL